MKEDVFRFGSAPQGGGEAEKPKRVLEREHGPNLPWGAFWLGSFFSIIAPFQMNFWLWAFRLGSSFGIIAPFQVNFWLLGAPFRIDSRLGCLLSSGVAHLVKRAES